MRHDDDQSQGRVVVPLFLSVFFIIFILSVVRSCNGADTAAITAPLEAAKTELTAKLKTARAKLIDGLKREEKAAQAAGKLDLTLAIRARLAELESLLGQNPFEKTETIESAPVEGSMAEKLYLAETTAASTVLAKKIEAGLAQLESKKIAATKAGRIDEALSYDDVILDVKNIASQLNVMLPNVKLAAFAKVELTQGLHTPVVSLKNGASGLMNFQQSYVDVPTEMLGLKFNQIRYGEKQIPTIKVVTPGKIFFVTSETTATRLKAVVAPFKLNCDGQIHTVYQLTLEAGKTITFKDEAVVYAQDLVVKTSK